MNKVVFYIVFYFVNVNFLSASIELIDLRCENLINPNGIDNISPHFSWKIQSDTSIEQYFYEIQVASDSVQLINNKADLWSSDRIRSSTSVMVPYKGRTLKSRTLCYWRVRVWDESGKVSAWSPVQRFAIGVLENDKLMGHYIGLSKGDVKSPILRKSFAIDKFGTTFLHVNSLGYHEIYINGMKVSGHVLSPAVSQLNKRSLVVTYDATPYLHEGQNEIILWLGQGWYKSTTYGSDHEGPVVKAEMNTMQNKKWVPIITTDDTWIGTESGYSDTGTWRALQFSGERIDRRLLPDDLTMKGVGDLMWEPVKIIQIADHSVSPQMCEPNTIQEVIFPKSMEALDRDSWLVDMGKVLTGWFELSIPQLAEGHEITITYSDYITKDGYIEEQGESDIYIASGKVGDLFCNKFNHHAFRYVKITNLPKRPSKGQIKSYLIHGDYQPTTTFRCSDNDLNAIHDMIGYTLRCLTFSGYMVDCPHLERAGYGGDGNSSTQVLQTMFDVSPTFMNWLQAWKDVMREGGSLPHVAPNPGAGGGGPYWCGFIVLAPWRTYVNYADSRLLDRYYDTMKQWMNYVEEYTVDGLLKRWPDTPYRDWYLGDWLAPHGVDTGSQLSVDLVNNCFISECLHTMQRIAFTLNKHQEAREFEDRRNNLNQLIHKTFYNAERNIYSTGSQLDMSYPMLVGAVPDEIFDAVKDKLISSTSEQYNGHIAVGLLGVPILTEWAIQNREANFIYSMLKKEDYPGYLYMLNNNATTTWEYWSGERSRVHNCYNGIGSWFYQAIGGLRVDEKNPGYRHFFIEPQIPNGITWAHTTKESPYGTIIVNWELKENGQNMRISLPVGTRASIIIPNGTLRCIVNDKEVDPNVNKHSLLVHAGTYEIHFDFQFDK